MPYTPQDSKMKILEEILAGTSQDMAEDLRKRYKTPPPAPKAPAEPEEDPLKDADPDVLEALTAE